MTLNTIKILQIIYQNNSILVWYCCFEKNSYFLFLSVQSKLPFELAIKKKKKLKDQWIKAHKNYIFGKIFSFQPYKFFKIEWEIASWTD